MSTITAPRTTSTEAMRARNRDNPGMAASVRASETLVMLSPHASEAHRVHNATSDVHVAHVRCGSRPVDTLDESEPVGEPGGPVELRRDHECALSVDVSPFRSGHDDRREALREPAAGPEPGRDNELAGRVHVPAITLAHPRRGEPLAVELDVDVHEHRLHRDSSVPVDESPFSALSEPGRRARKPVEDLEPLRRDDEGPCVIDHGESLVDPYLGPPLLERFCAVESRWNDEAASQIDVAPLLPDLHVHEPFLRAPNEVELGRDDQRSAAVDGSPSLSDLDGDELTA